ncbi:MAG: IS256 family transposase [Bacillota bacterium]
MKLYKKFNAGSKSFSGKISSIPVKLAVEGIMRNASAGLEEVMTEAGLAVIRQIMEGERQRHLEDGRGYRHGSQRGWIQLGGRKVNIESLRMRKNKGGEIPLSSYKAFQGGDELARRAYGDMIRNVSTRDYQGGVEGFMRGYGISKSSVSRRFITASEEKLRELMERRLDKLDLAAILIDGKGFGDILVITALGIDITGRKHVLGLWQGATENAAVCEALLADLIRRGLDTRRRYLFITDGSKALRKAIKKTFGGMAATQRCQEHKKRNVLGHLPEGLQPEYRRKLNAAYAMTEYGSAKAALWACVRELERINPSAAASLEEGLEDTLTLHRLGASEALRKSLRTTNCIESAFSSVGYRTGRVTRWRGGDHVQRWAAAALLFAESRWRKVKGWKHLKSLREALDK